MGEVAVQQGRGENAPPLARLQHERFVQPAKRGERVQARRKLAVRLDGENQFDPIDQAEHNDKTKGDKG